MKRIRLKRRKKSRFKILLIIIIFIFITSIYSISILSKNVTPYLLNSAKLKVNRYSLAVINSSINNAIKEKIDLDKLFIVTSNNGVIEMIDFNPNIVNNMLYLITSSALTNLKLLEAGDFDLLNLNIPIENIDKNNLKKGIITYVPTGSFLKIPLLSNIGPRIPIRLHYTGDINSNITTKVKSYGINNVLLEVGIHIEVTAQVIFPLSSDLSMITADIPIAIKLIQGSIPSYYSGNQITGTYSLPIN